MEKQGEVILPLLLAMFLAVAPAKHQATWAPAALVAIMAEVAMLPEAQLQMRLLGSCPAAF